MVTSLQRSSEKNIYKVEELARLSLIQLLSILMWTMGGRSKVEGGLTSAISTNLNEEGPLPSIKLVRKQFGGRYAISSEEFTSEVVGAKSRNIGYLKGKLPSWVGIPTSVALPFGVFEKVLSDGLNQGLLEKFFVPFGIGQMLPLKFFLNKI
ncbi:alpha-glucan water dikinase, chloroplastic-like isoform X1 [Camellia sinensis]|uniref:alpha-glucan water dikinase, chloroplastic-like isoform X1 n=1 Tax=Camellia sinensis TaxID=4442 RepID=UPI0010364A8F|nr:alpha-glucan water dikinase, chloroplastic-like isoform X1 [Camellia sinensis]XP_028072764.1 alpha-glucan water dikinase, chloroplastic-like isoform X1 [Camellia sinensis]